MQKVDFYDVERGLDAAGCLSMANLYRNHYAVYEKAGRAFVAQVSLLKGRFDVQDFHGNTVKRCRTVESAVASVLSMRELSNTRLTPR